ncbi:MAG: nickel pincer cofactor biosynthesis protein LarC [Streptosporangiales bacterium]
MIGWIDCVGGASGDMLLGAVVDAGVPLEVLQSAVGAIGAEPIELVSEPASRHGLAATKVDVRAGEGGETRTWADVREMLASAGLEQPVRDRAEDVFARLARAEARAHGIDVELVHFHEVGALDAIADIVGASAGMHALGLDRVVVSPVPLGSGLANGMHGGIPVPGPAVLAVLGEAGAPVHGGEVPVERTTPTGAALLASLASGWGAMPAIRVSGVGVGAGSMDMPEVPNVLRLVLGDPTDAGDGVVSTDLLVEANVDDLDPRLWPAVLERLLAAGASDAWLTPILMKKGRPAHTLAVLVPAARVHEVRRTVFTETSTIGVRETQVTKRALARERTEVEVGGRRIGVKVALLDGRVVNAQPEYEEVAAAAAALGRPVRDVLADAAAAARAARTA